MTRLSHAQVDRACGVLIASAAGDSLGAGYEFGLESIGPEGPQMIGGGLGDFAPGEWTDDTSMAWAIADVAATGVDLRSDDALTAIARRFREWYDTRPSDIGNQTRAVLSAAGATPTGDTMTATSFDLHARTAHTGGNGSLMRTAPVAIAFLDDPAGLSEAARRISAMTHCDPRAQEACELWCQAIRHAVLTGELDVRIGLSLLSEESRGFWAERIDEAETMPPSRFRPNGYVVTALQAAWAAISQTPVPTDRFACEHLVDALAAAVWIGDDTDTVAAIAGGLLGARWGMSAVPAEWRRLLHGYPGICGNRLEELAVLIARRGGTAKYGWPLVDHIDYTGYQYGRTPLVRHPHDDGVWLAGAPALDDVPEDVDAVVTLCLTGRTQVPAELEHIKFRLMDEPSRRDNPNLDHVLVDAAKTVAALRDEGKVVLLHCVAAFSRTPTVATAYSMLRGAPMSVALRDVLGVLPNASPNPGFLDALARLDEMDLEADDPMGLRLLR